MSISTVMRNCFFFIESSSCLDELPRIHSLSEFKIIVKNITSKNTAPNDDYAEGDRKDELNSVSDTKKRKPHHTSLDSLSSNTSTIPTSSSPSLLSSRQSKRLKLKYEVEILMKKTETVLDLKTKVSVVD